MKKSVSICLVCLLSLTAVAQVKTTRRLRVEVLPKEMVTTTVSFSYYIGGTSYGYSCQSDTVDVIDCQVPVGQEVNISVIPYSGTWTAKNWMANGLPADLYSTDSKYYTYTMPDENVYLTALFEYSPSMPNYHPGLGSWDSETGTLIMDYGNTSVWPEGFNVNNDKEKVTRFIWGGTTLERYYIEHFTNCQTYDISRTSVEEIGGSARAGDLDDLSITEILLPATMKTIRQNAFKNTHLQQFTCFAVTPPVLAMKAGAYDSETQTYGPDTQVSFPDSPDMVVRVPAEALDLYKQAPGWKDFTILAMDQHYVNLTLKLMAVPTDAALAPYKNMQIELVSKHSGQVQRRLMNGLNLYEFRYLPENTNYSLVLRNSRGIEVAKIDNVFMEKEDKTVTFDRLKDIHNLSLTLMDGTTMADQSLYHTSWLYASGSYLARGLSLPNMVEGEKLCCVVDFDRDMAMKYQLPDTVTVVVGQDADDIVLPLKPLRDTLVTFTVVDSLTNQGIDKATIQLTQLLPGLETGKILLLTTGSNGVAQGMALSTQSLVTVTSPMHGSVEFAANLNDSTNYRTVFVPADGTTIQINHLFRPAVYEGEEPRIQKVYDEGQQLNYTFMAHLPDGKDTVITHYLTSYPLYRLYGQLPQGTRLRVVATDDKGSIQPATAEALVGEDKNVSVTLPIVERGYIEATYVLSETNKPAALVFNKNGDLVKKQVFERASRTRFTNLPEGQYEVAVMSQGVQYAGIGSKAQLEQYVADKDYFIQEVTVSDGLITRVSFGVVPLTTTQLETNLKERRAQWSDLSPSVGFSTTLTVNVAFDGLTYKQYDSYGDPNLPTDCKLEVYWPQGLVMPAPYRSRRVYIQPLNENKMAASSHAPRKTWRGYNDGMKEYGTLEDVLAGFHYSYTAIEMVSAKSTWDAAERKLTIDWPAVSEGGKVSLVTYPVSADDYRPEIYLTYTLHGKPMREMIPCDGLTVTKSGILAPELVVTPTFNVSGTAMYAEELSVDTTETALARGPMKASETHTGMARPTWENPEYYEVTVMDNGQPIGKANINNKGEWSANCTLVNPASLSSHDVYAVIQPQKGGYKYETAHKTVKYDPNGVVARSVKMSFFNHHPVHLENTEVLFDLTTQKATPRSYGYDNTEGYNTDFTFEINLSNNDTTKVYAVDLAIFTKGPDAEEFIIPARYNARKNRWIAYWKFNTRSLPYNVNVRPYYHGDAIGSASDVQDVYDTFASWGQRDQQADSIAKAFLACADQIQRAIDANDERLLPDPEEILGLLDQMGDPSLDADIVDSIDPEEAEAIMARLEAAAQGMQEWEIMFANGMPDLNTLGSYLEGITFGTAEGLTAESLKADGFEELLLDDGRKLYTKLAEGSIFTFVDLASNLTMRCDYSKVSAARGIMHVSSLDVLHIVEDVAAKIDELRGYVDKINTGVSALSDMINVMINSNNAAMKAAKDVIRCDLRDKIWPYWSKTIVRNATHLAKLESETKILNKAKSAVDQFKFGTAFGCMSSLWGIVSDALKAFNDLKWLVKIYRALPDPCPDDQANCNALSSDLVKTILAVGAYQSTVIANDVAGVVMAFSSVLGISTGVLSPVGLLGVACSLAQFGLSYAASKIYDSNTANMAQEFAYRKSELRCNKNKKKDKKKCNGCDDDEYCEDCGGGDGTGGDGTGGGGGDGTGGGGTGGSSGTGGGSGSGAMGGGTSGSEGMLDPSGFVYEGVPENRLEGVTTTVFYKENAKNQFGDDVEKVVKWDAEYFGQVNPQLTNENGEYGWMVPTGLWQVKYEKDGYLTEYSEWLPVPPPQLDVNQAMTQFSQPYVSDVKATQEQVQVTFDKYVQTASLTQEHISVTQGGKAVGGAIALVYGGEDSTKVQKVRFVPTQTLPAGQMLTLTVSGEVESYAGIPMGQTFTQDFTVKAVAEQIVADSAIHVLYDEATTLIVQALPVAATAGKKVTARVLCDMIASINDPSTSSGRGNDPSTSSGRGNDPSTISGQGNDVEATLDGEGKAAFTITGEAHGTTAVVVRMQDDADVKAVVVVDVKDPEDFVCPMPVSNYRPSQAYPSGTQITLSCDLPEATIWYTLDGSCPCVTGDNVYKYEQPITLVDDMLIKAYATAPGWADSDVAEMTFCLDLGDGIRIVGAGQRVWSDTAVYDLQGRKIDHRSSDNRKLRRGIYLRNGQKFVVK